MTLPGRTHLSPGRLCLVLALRAVSRVLLPREPRQLYPARHSTAQAVRARHQDAVSSGPSSQPGRCPCHRAPRHWGTRAPVSRDRAGRRRSRCAPNTGCGWYSRTLHHGDSDLPNAIFPFGVRNRAGAAFAARAARPSPGRTDRGMTEAADLLAKSRNISNADALKLGLAGVFAVTVREGSRTNKHDLT